MKDTHTDSADQIEEFRPNKKKSSGSLGSILKIDTTLDSPAANDAYTNINAPTRRAKVNYTAVRKQLALFKKLTQFNLTPSTGIQ